MAVETDEQTPLLQTNGTPQGQKPLHHEDNIFTISNSLEEDEPKVFCAAVGERLPYNEYTTIDFLHDKVKETHRLRSIQKRTGIHFTALRLWDRSTGWIAAAVIGILTACVAFLVDIAEATVSDWKQGYCTRNPFMTREACCENKTPLLLFTTANATSTLDVGDNCGAWHKWSTDFSSRFMIYVGFALLFGIISGSVTLITKQSMPAAAPGIGDQNQYGSASGPPNTGKAIYMAAGSGIPEIKTILAGFVIPNFLDFKVLAVKAVGAVFAVASSMCLGKEGPFVHISTCVGWLIASRIPKYRGNGRQMREMLSVSCAAGLSVAFGAPIGGVLFSYEEISTYFPRKVLWRAFLCSLFAAMTLRELNPNGTGKLVLFETNYRTSYHALHYFAFVFLGLAGGAFGGVFCKLNFIWSKWFRGFAIIKNYPVFEVFLVVLATGLIQYPNPLTREPGDTIIGNLLVDCRDGDSQSSWVCTHEADAVAYSTRARYYGYLAYGTLAKLVLTIITFGIKVPSGIIIPSLDAGAFFGRLVGQIIPGNSPGIFALVGSAAFLAGVSRMTISLCVIMFELTGELEYVLPNMIAILVAKWVADAIGREGVYDLAQTVLGHPFLDLEHATQLVQSAHTHGRAIDLVPPRSTMDEISVSVPKSHTVPYSILNTKLQRLKERGLLDAGLVLVTEDTGRLLGYLAQSELDFGLYGESGSNPRPGTENVLVLPIDSRHDSDGLAGGQLDISHFVDRTPLTVAAGTPIEYVVEMFGKLGLRHLMVVEEESAKLIGVIIKKRLVAYLEMIDNE